MIKEAAFLVSTAASPSGASDAYESFPQQFSSVDTCWSKAIVVVEDLSRKHPKLEIGALCISYKFYLRGDKLEYLNLK